MNGPKVAMSVNKQKAKLNLMENFTKFVALFTIKLKSPKTFCLVWKCKCCSFKTYS